MHIAVVHGFFLGDSGSAIYARELAHEFTRQGHEVTLICQEQQPQDYDFIDSVYDFAEGNSSAGLVFERETGYAGSCRLVRPHIHDYLPTYVPGPFPPFEAVPLQDTATDLVERYIADNIAALTAAFDRWPPDLVQANHAVLQPYLVKEALRGGAPYVATIHGSELNFTVRRDLRMAPYLVEGLAGAAAVAALSETSREEVIDLAGRHRLDISGKVSIVPPGVDTGLFVSDKPRAAALAAVSETIDPELDDIAVFAGRLLWTKGLHHIIAALPIILQQRPRFQLIVVGEGPLREPLQQLIELMENGKLADARALLAGEPALEGVDGYGPVMPEMAGEDEQLYLMGALGDLSRRIHFTGHLSHQRLAPLFGAADVSLAPSIFPEAFGLVSIEALAAGALPVATYQTGLRTPLDIIADELGDPVMKALIPGTSLTESLAGNILHLLDNYDTRDVAFRGRLHSLAERQFSWAVVASSYLEVAAG